MEAVLEMVVMNSVVVFKSLNLEKFKYHKKWLMKFNSFIVYFAAISPLFLLYKSMHNDFFFTYGCKANIRVENEILTVT